MCIAFLPVTDYAIRNLASQERGDDGTGEDAWPLRQTAPGSKHRDMKSQAPSDERSKKSRSSGRHKTSKHSRESKARERSNSETSRSSSSCGEDESYYEYKQRMLQKGRADTASVSSEKSDRSRSDRDVGERSDRADKTFPTSGRKDRDDRTYSASDRKKEGRRGGKANSSARSVASSQGEEGRSHLRDSPKKKSSTFSGPGQAEPVKRPSEREEDDVAARDHRGVAAATSADAGGERGGRGGKGHNRGPEVGDTADEVSDIESEMAASPRKTGLAGNTCTLQRGSPAGSPRVEDSDKNRDGKRDEMANDRKHCDSVRAYSGRPYSGRENSQRESSKKIGINESGAAQSHHKHGSMKISQSSRTNLTCADTEGCIVDKSKKKKRETSSKRDCGSKGLAESRNDVNTSIQVGQEDKGEESSAYDRIGIKNSDAPVVDGGPSDAVEKHMPERKEQAEVLKATPAKVATGVVIGVTACWERVLDAGEGGESGGLELNLDPGEQPSHRGERGSALTDRDEAEAAVDGAESDSRGARVPHDPAQWAIYQSGRPLEATSAARRRRANEAVDKELEERAGLADGDKKKSEKSSRKDNKRRSNVSCRQVNSLLDGTVLTDQNGSLKNATPRKKEDTHDYPNAAAQDTSLQYEGKPLFSSKITSIPMPKTGENKHLKRQEAELAEAQRRKKSESLKANLRDPAKRNGRYYEDVSQPEPVIRGFVGDSLSDNEDDETYSRLGPLDDRANLLDLDRDLAGPKDYVLSSARDVSVAVSSASALSETAGGLKQDSHATVDVVLNGEGVGGNTHTMDARGEAPTYRVLLGNEDIAARKTSGIREIERLKREEEREEEAQNQLDDVRGKTRSRGKAKTKPSHDERPVRHDPDLHPSIREASSKQYGRDPESYYSPKYPRVDSEGSDLNATTAGEPPTSLRHPQLRTTPSPHADTLAFRHSFVEEPAPRIFRPGIDDKTRIQAHVTVTGDQSAVSEIDISREREPETEENLHQDESPTHKSVSFETDETKEKSKSLEDGAAESRDENTSGLVEIGKDLLSSSDSSTGSSDQTSSSDSSSESSSSNQARLEIVGTRYVEKEEARYARHHKAFQEAPVVGHQEFTETGATLSVLSPCDRSGLPSAPQSEGFVDVNRMLDTAGSAELDVCDTTDSRRDKTRGVVSDEINGDGKGIPCLSVNTPGPEYDKEDREFEKSQREKKRLEKAFVERDTHVNETKSDPQGSHSVKVEGHRGDGNGLGGSHVSSEIKTETGSEIVLPNPCSAVEVKVDNEPKMGQTQESTHGVDGIEAVGKESRFEVHEENLASDKGERSVQEDVSNTMTGTDIMDIYLGRRRSSGAIADHTGQFKHVPSASGKCNREGPEEAIEEGEEKENNHEEAQGKEETENEGEWNKENTEKYKDREVREEKASRKDVKDTKDGDVDHSSYGVRETEYGKAGTIVPHKLETAIKSDQVGYSEVADDNESPMEPPSRGLSRHRESVTATNLMDLWLGGERARETRDKVDQVMHHVSDDMQLPRVSVPPSVGGGETLNNGKCINVANSDTCQDAPEIIRDSDQVDGAAGRGDTTPREVNTRRDSNYHADDDDSGSSSGRHDDSSKSQTKSKKIKKTKSKGDQSGVTDKENLEAEVNHIVITTPEKVEGDASNDTEIHGEVEHQSDVASLSRKGSVPDVFIITTEGDRFASHINAESNEGECVNLPVNKDAIGSNIDTHSEAMLGEFPTGQNKSEGSDVDQEDSPACASDVSGVDALIACLENQLSDGSTPHLANTPGELSIGKEDGTLSLNMPSALDTEKEVDSLLEKLDATQKTLSEESDPSPEKAAFRQTDETLSKELDRTTPTSDEDVQLESCLGMEHVPSVGAAADPELSSGNHSSTAVSIPSVQMAPGSEFIASLDDAETISGTDEDDAARRYVERILRSVTFPDYNGEARTGTSGTSVPGEKESIVDSIDSRALCERPKGQRVALTRDRQGLDGTETEEFVVQAVDASQAVTDGDSHVTRRNSTLQVAGSEHSERRKQRKLTVSFADDGGEGDDDDDDVVCGGGGRSKAKMEEVPWESVDEGSKEDEYEKLERQLERSLKIT